MQNKFLKILNSKLKVIIKRQKKCVPRDFSKQSMESSVIPKRMHSTACKKHKERTLTHMPGKKNVFHNGGQNLRTDQVHVPLIITGFKS